jgi:Fe-S-cluster containining protein
MTDESHEKKAVPAAGETGGWDLGEVQRRWDRCLEDLSASPGFDMPLKRLRFQAQEDPELARIMGEWPNLEPEAREQAWKDLMEVAARAASEVLPMCVGTGDCCRKGSPALFDEDLELLKNEEIPWGQLLTLRRGERARSPDTGEPFDLPVEHIKIREDPETGACIFYDEAGAQCSIYVHRPLQCRAQACWDPEPGLELLEEAKLSRERLFQEVPVLRDLIVEHESRWPFSALREAMEALERSSGEQVDPVLRLLAEEASFRDLVVEKMKIPKEVLDFLFGRSYADLVPLFGLQVVTEEDGIRILRPKE